MPEALFRAPFYPLWQQTIQKAVAEVGSLDRSVFSDPGLAGALQRIAQKYSLSVARINKDKIQARARAEQAQVNDGWGGIQNTTRGWLDVTIPFGGDAESFRICPSRSIIPSHGADIRRDHLVLTIPDDNSAELAVQAFVTQITQNLDGLRAEYEQHKPELEQAVHQAGERRRAQASAEKERDAKLSFPVSR